MECIIAADSMDSAAGAQRQNGPSARIVHSAMLEVAGMQFFGQKHKGWYVVQGVPGELSRNCWTNVI